MSKIFPQPLRQRLHGLRKFLRRARIFFADGGWRRLSARDFLRRTREALAQPARVAHPGRPRIFWLGAFPPTHSNLGDQAQTHAVQRFLRDHFADFAIVRLYRTDLAAKRIRRLGATATCDDRVFIHSSGDFGNRYAGGPGSFHATRLQILEAFPDTPVVNLPTTVYYENSPEGHQALRRDADRFSRPDLTILAREQESAQTLADHFSCGNQFFPDFVFYLKPQPRRDVQRRGALVILREDSEAGVTPGERTRLLQTLRDHFDRVDERDLLATQIPVIDAVRRKLLDRVFQTVMEYELVVTDRMHGMITAAITRTPCIALAGAIPHKISAYQDFLSGCVQFPVSVDEIESALAASQDQQFSPPDLTHHFQTFRQSIAQL